MRPSKRSLSVINDGVKFSVFFESQMLRRILCAASGSNVNQFRKRSVFLYFLQCKPLAPLFLRKQRYAVPQQYGGDLQDHAVHQILIQQRGKYGVSADDPDIFVSAQLSYKLCSAAVYRDPPLERQCRIL